MADYLIKGETLKNIADAIRSKTGTTEDIKAKDMASTIETISTGTDTSDATATPEDIMEGKTAYIASGETTGTFTINSEITTQEDLISNIKTALIGKASGGEPKLQSKTITPSKNQQTIRADSGYDGLSSVVINGDNDLVSENIKDGINIFGIDGSYVGNSGGSSVETVTVNMWGGHLDNYNIMFLDETLNIQNLIVCDGDDYYFQVVKNSIIVMEYVDGVVIDGEIEPLIGDEYMWSFIARGDGSIGKTM